MFRDDICIFHRPRWHDGYVNTVDQWYGQSLQRQLKHFVDPAHGHDRQILGDLVRNFRQVFLILFRNQYRLDATARGRQQFFLQSADRQNLTAQSDLESGRAYYADVKARMAKIGRKGGAASRGSGEGETGGGEAEGQSGT